MKKTTQKNLRYMVEIGAAKNADNLTKAEREILYPIEKLAASYGVYGVNGLLLRSCGGRLYVVTARNSALFYFL